MSGINLAESSAMNRNVRDPTCVKDSALRGRITNCKDGKSTIFIRVPDALIRLLEELEAFVRVPLLG